MTTYMLGIQIDDEGLNTINGNGQSVCLAKKVGTAETASNNQPTVWVKFSPGEDNKVTWDENYRLYASASKILDGAQISTESKTKDVVSLGYLYNFNKDNYFDGPVSGKPRYYSVKNGSNWTIGGQRKVSSGLYQVGKVTGGSDEKAEGPLNVCYIPYNETGAFGPEETVYIWAEVMEDTGIVKEDVTTGVLAVTYAAGETDKTVHYDDKDNVFKLGPLPGA
jgi:hypothetical protein